MSKAVQIRFSCLCSILAAILGLASVARADSQVVAPPLPLSIIQSRIDVLRYPALFEPAKAKEYKVDSAKLKGWDFVFEKLVRSGFNPSYLEKVFSDPRMPMQTTVFFAVAPREPHSLYSRANTKVRQQLALNCYQKYGPYFRKASAHFRVPETILLSILQIETSCGAVLGQDKVFARLARLVHAADPDNIKINYAQNYSNNQRFPYAAVQARAEWLETTFLPHLAGTLFVAAELNEHPLDVRGSSGGAIGVPQFLPGNYLEYGVDGDGDKVVDLFNVPDAILSTANFLRKHGWEQRTMTKEEKKAVILRYNNSDPYVETILAMADALEARLDKLRHEQATVEKPKESKK